jgi:hypothetical protein
MHQSYENILDLFPVFTDSVIVDLGKLIIIMTIYVRVRAKTRNNPVSTSQPRRGTVIHACLHLEARAGTYPILASSFATCMPASSSYAANYERARRNRYN